MLKVFACRAEGRSRVDEEGDEVEYLLLVDVKGIPR